MSRDQLSPAITPDAHASTSLLICAGDDFAAGSLGASRYSLGVVFQVMRRERCMGQLKVLQMAETVYVIGCSSSRLVLLASQINSLHSSELDDSYQISMYSSIVSSRG